MLVPTHQSKKEMKMKSELKTQIDNMAKALGEQIEIKEGEATIAADAYIKTLPEGLDMETLKKIQDHNANFFPAVTKAFGEKSIEAMKTNTALAQLDLSVPMVGDDRFDVTFKRSYDHMDMASKEMKTSFGGVSASLTVQAARHNRGAMSTINSDLKEMALAAFGKD
jgi:adenylyl- and sulfurtransferase ThiI